MGEHAVGSKLPRLLEKEFYVRDVGFPSGTDQRFVLKSQKIYEITKELTDSVWLFVDIKSVGPRDDAPHAVMSHNQVSGDGLWEKPETGVRNTVLIAKGQRSNHLFHCSLPPLFVLSDGTITPTIIFVIKPVYRMLSLNKKVQAGVEGQPLSRIGLASIPNGLLLTENPGYVKTYPGLFFPGKDDKGKNPLKVRARIDFDILEKIASWRYREIFIREEADQA